MTTYDLVILGGGPAGYLAAERASHAGMKTALFERRSLGGVCLNEGCVPTKSLLHSAKAYEYALHGSSYGVRVDGGVAIDMAAVIARKDRVVKTLVAGISAKMRGGGVDVFKSTGAVESRSDNGFTVVSAPDETSERIAGGGSNQNRGVESGEITKIEAKKLLIATGSTPVLPPIAGSRDALDRGYAVTSREILETKTAPERLVIVGGGVIGLEMADFFASAGSKVTVVEALQKIGGSIEEEVSDILLANLKKKGVTFYLGHQAVSVVPGEGVAVSRVPAVSGAIGTGLDKSAQSRSGDGKNVETLAADKVLLCIGRRPSCEGAGLETVGVFVERGAVKTDARMKTNIPGIYAAGDVNGVSMLAHTAYREAEVAVNNMLGIKDVMRYDAIPSVVYTTPEVACVGETEESARAKGANVLVKKLPMRYSGRYVAETTGAGSGDGICKLVLDASTTRLLGAHIIGNYASEIIFSAAMMIDSKWPLDALKRFVFPHPTVCEILRETIFEF